MDVTLEDRESYRLRIAAGGCKHADCDQEGRPEFAVWWKCPDGHREEFRYCRGHGPEMLDYAVRSGAVIECRCRVGWMTVLAEAAPADPAAKE